MPKAGTNDWSRFCHQASTHPARRLTTITGATEMLGVSAGSGRRADVVYLFIDGAFLKTVYRDRFQPIFGNQYTLDFNRIKPRFNARRVFYYDCLDDVQKPNEDEAVYRERVQKQKDWFDEID